MCTSIWTSAPTELFNDSKINEKSAHLISPEIMSDKNGKILSKELKCLLANYMKKKCKIIL